MWCSNDMLSVSGDPFATKKTTSRKSKTFSKTQALLNELPDGVRFIGQPEQFTEAYFIRQEKRQKNFPLLAISGAVTV